MDCDSKNIGSNPIIYPMRFKYIINIYTDMKLMLFKKTTTKDFFYKGKWKTLAYTPNNFDLDHLKQVNLLVSQSFNFIKFNKIKKTSIFINSTNYNYYLHFLKTIYIYNILCFDKIKKNIYCWLKYDIKSLTLVFPWNSRYKFAYSKNVKNIFLTLSAGMLLKIFNNKKKSHRQQKKTFKLGLFFLKKIIKLPNKYFLILTFRTLHKRLRIYLKYIIKYFKLTTKNYFCYYDYKKFYHFFFFKKKRSIKKKLQKRLLLRSKL